MKITDIDPEERPREKLIRDGAKSLSNAELLAILLRTGTAKKGAHEIAAEVLSKTGGRLTPLAEMPLDELCAIDGIGTLKAATVSAVFEIGRRFLSESVPEKEIIVTPEGIYRLMIPILKGLTHEECWVVLLNRARYVCGKFRMSSGGAESTVIDVRGIIAKALQCHACALILVHNHPTGNPHPSKEDIEQTRILKEASSAMDLSLLDHIIISDGSFYSFADEKVKVLF